LIPSALCENEQNEMIEAAIETLTEYWRAEVYSFAPEDSAGYLEIKNVRVVKISDAPKAGIENAQEYADEIFGEIDCVVEFILYSDTLGIAPYYQNAGAWDCVVVREDGTMEVLVGNPFASYRSRTYSMDVSGIVENVMDFNQEYNAVMYLLEE
jgi:hypothetical protein